MTDERKPLEEMSTIELLTRYRSIQVKRGTEFRSNYLEMNALLDEAKRRDAALAELRQPAAPDARLICYQCNDYLEHPSYCEMCYATMESIAQAAPDEWEPVDFVGDDDVSVEADNIDIMIIRDGVAMDTFVWPDDGYEYRLQRRLMRPRQE